MNSHLIPFFFVNLPNSCRLKSEQFVEREPWLAQLQGTRQSNVNTAMYELFFFFFYLLDRVHVDRFLRIEVETLLIIKKKEKNRNVREQMLYV